MWSLSQSRGVEMKVVLDMYMDMEVITFTNLQLSPIPQATGTYLKRVALGYTLDMFNLT